MTMRTIFTRRKTEWLMELIWAVLVIGTFCALWWVGELIFARR